MKKDDDITIDLGKIKKIFSGDSNKKQHASHEKDDADVSIDLGKIKNIFSGSKDSKESKNKPKGTYSAGLFRSRIRA